MIAGWDALAEAGRERGGVRARHDRGHQRPAGASRRAHGVDHHRGLPGHHRDRPAGPRLAVRPDQAPAHRRWCRGTCGSWSGSGWVRPASSSRSTGDSLAAAVDAVAAAERRGGRGVPAVRLPAPRARACGRCRRCGNDCPTCAVSLSCEVLPEFREYERMSTTVADAYLRPRLSALPQQAGGQVGRGRAARAAGHAVLRRGGRRRNRGPTTRRGSCCPVRPAGWWARRTSRGAVRVPERADLRHGRHQHGCRAGGGRAGCR